MNKQVLRDVVTTRPVLQELLKEALHVETTSTSHSKITLNAKEDQHNEESTSTNGRKSQLASKWQYQIHT